MFRPRLSLALPLLAAALLSSGCHTMYRDVYTPRKNYFKPVKEKSAAQILSEKESADAERAMRLQNATGGGTTAPTMPDAGSSSSPSAPAAPTIPGLDGTGLPTPPPPAM